MPHTKLPASWLALTLLLLSAAAFAYSLHLRRRDWRSAPPPAVTQLMPPSTPW